MSTLYLDRKETRLKREGRAIAVYQADQRYTTVPMALLERIVMRGSVELDSGLLGALAEAGIGVVILSGRQGRNMAIVQGRPHADAARRVAQFCLCAEADWRSEWSRRLVRHKLAAQARLLRRALVRRRDKRLVLTKALSTLDRLREELTMEQTTPSLETLRGMEGAGAAAYFTAFTRLFPPALEFTGRNRRPPRDPVNACLSLAYTMVHFETVQACYAAGLDPLVGFFHELSYGRESLACDLVEPLRPHVDEWVWGLFCGQTLRAENFSHEGQACLLNKGGRKIFYCRFEEWFCPFRRLLRRTTQRISRKLIREYEARKP